MFAEQSRRDFESGMKADSATAKTCAPRSGSPSTLLRMNFLIGNSIVAEVCGGPVPRAFGDGSGSEEDVSVHNLSTICYRMITSSVKNNVGENVRKGFRFPGRGEE